MENNSLDEEYRRLLRRGDEEREQRLRAERAAHVPESRPGPLPQWPADKDHMKVTEAALLLEAGYPSAPFVKPNDGALRSEISKVYRGVVDVAGDIVRFARASLIDLIHPTLGRSAFPDEADVDYFIGPEAFETVRNWIGNGAKPTALPEPVVIEAKVPPNEGGAGEAKNSAPATITELPQTPSSNEPGAIALRELQRGGDDTDAAAAVLYCHPKIKNFKLAGAVPSGRTASSKSQAERGRLLRLRVNKRYPNFRADYSST
jgi:hypothetical protein